MQLKPDQRLRRDQHRCRAFALVDRNIYMPDCVAVAPTATSCRNGPCNAARKHPRESGRIAITEAELGQAARTALPEDQARVVSQLIDWARKAQHALIFKRGANSAVFIPEVKLASGSLYPVSVRVTRGVVLMLHYLKRHPPFDTDTGRNELLDRLERIEGIELRGGMDGMPRVAFAALTREGARAALLESVDG